MMAENKLLSDAHQMSWQYRIRCGINNKQVKEGSGTNQKTTAVLQQATGCQHKIRLHGNRRVCRFVFSSRNFLLSRSDLNDPKVNVQRPMIHSEGLQIYTNDDTIVIASSNESMGNFYTCFRPSSSFLQSSQADDGETSNSNWRNVVIQPGMINRSDAQVG